MSVKWTELNPQALANAIKRYGVTMFNLARAVHPDWIPDLHGADLSGANLGPRVMGND